MTRTFSLPCLIASSLLAMSSLAGAATSDDSVAQVSSFSGPTVLANQGSGYNGLTPGMTLKPGDTVVAGESSEVRIYYVKEQCEYTVAAKTSYVVDAVAPCKEAVTGGMTPETQVAIAAGVAVAGGAAVVVLVAGTDDNGGDDKPASP